MAVLTRPPGWSLRKTHPPGYRFDPTDLELILFYLKNKVLAQNLATVDGVMPEVDLYKLSPWVISEKCFKRRDQQEYFFCRHEKKFTSSSRTKRSTNTGQWKTTGRDKKILHKSRTVGMRRTLVFYVRGPLQGGRTNWVIYEYSLCNWLLGDSGAVKNGYVLCKLFEKSCSDANNYNPWAGEDSEDDACGDDVACILNSSLTGDSGLGIPCSKDIVEERESCISDYTNFSFDFSGFTSQEVTSYSESSSCHKNNGCQHSSFSLEEDYDIGADIDVAAPSSSFHERIPVIQLPSECDENSFDLESTLLSCQTDDFDCCSSQQENTSPMVSSLMNCPVPQMMIMIQQNNITPKNFLCNHPLEPTAEFGFQESSMETLNIYSIYGQCPIDTECYSIMNFDQCQQQNEVAFFPPGFRFSPTETQLLLFYLRNKALGQKLTIVDEVMPEVDLYKFSPWDISEKCFKSRDQQEYFFCRHERKFASGMRKKRSTISGQWRTTGRDKKIHHKSQALGMKRTLVFYVQGPLQVERTNWVIYEYSLCAQQLGYSGALKHNYVLCKLSKKSHSNKNYRSSAVEDCEDDAYSDDFAFVLNSSLTGGMRPDVPLCSKDIMEERVSCIPDKSNFTFDFPGTTSQEVTSHLESSTLHKNKGWQHGSCTLEETYEVHTDVCLYADVSSSSHRIPIIHLSSEHKKDSFDIETTLLNSPSDEIDGHSSQLENTFQTKSLCYHPPELTPEFESHESSKDIFYILPIDELSPIDPQCYCTLDLD